LCLALALWNGRDPILKERLFGLTNGEGNHGEDVKELDYYLDATPTHSYLKMLYKYPQGEFPYARLVDENRRRGRDQPEFELLDTGVFDDDRYIDVFVEYAKAGPDGLLMQVTVHNRGPEAAVIHLLPQLWFRNTWSWKGDRYRPELSVTEDVAIAARHHDLGNHYLYAEDGPPLLFCDNETNAHRLYGANSVRGYFKDAFHDRVIHDRVDAVNPQQTGTKAAGAVGRLGGHRRRGDWPSSLNVKCRTARLSWSFLTRPLFNSRSAGCRPSSRLPNTTTRSSAPKQGEARTAD
jgi:hypothetical protein